MIDRVPPAPETGAQVKELVKWANATSDKVNALIAQLKGDEEDGEE